MRSSNVLKILVTAVLCIFIGCGDDHKKSKNDAPQVHEEQQETTDESSGDKEEDKKPGSTQLPIVKPPVKPNPPAPNPPVPAPTFGQIVAADQESIQTKLLNHYCVACHRGATPAANLNLESLTPYLTGELGANGYRGVLLFPSRADVSTLKLVMAHHESYSAMPPTDNALKIPTVTAQQVEAVSTWINGLKSSDDDGGIGRN